MFASENDGFIIDRHWRLDAFTRQRVWVLRPPIAEWVNTRYPVLCAVIPEDGARYFARLRNYRRHHVT